MRDLVVFVLAAFIFYPNICNGELLGDRFTGHPNFKVALERNVFLELDLFSQFDKTYLTESSLNELRDHMGNYLTNDNVEISLEGFTDQVGDHEYNKQLGRLRSIWVKSYLIANGVEEGRIRILLPSTLPNDQNSNKRHRKVRLIARTTKEVRAE